MQNKLEIADAIDALNSWFYRNEEYTWGRIPQTVVDSIIEYGKLNNTESIPYSVALGFLQEAEVSKMSLDRNANRGMEVIKNKWKRLSDD